MSAGRIEPALDAVRRYHDGTKHHFQRFARSLGYLDWASQPDPFRSYTGAPLFPLPRVAMNARDEDPDGHAPPLARVTYDQLVQDGSVAPVAITAAAIGDVLRHSLGLSAWKQFGASRWSLRVNPSSGNLHPTEAYVVAGALDGLADTPGVYHYAADRHALEMRCAFAAGAWTAACRGSDAILLVALTSIHWREAWKYGERAFRYCQHDLGHAIAAVALAAALAGWRAVVLPSWSQALVAALTGLDREDDFVEAEREEPGCLMVVTAGEETTIDGAALVEAVRHGAWSGRASQLSEDHVDWTFIDEVAQATEDPGREGVDIGLAVARGFSPAISDRRIDARALMIRRRSALAFDGSSRIDRTRFLLMLSRVMPRARAPWHTIWWTPRIHLALFVHRVDGLDPGLYLLPRDPQVLDRFTPVCGRDFLWTRVNDEPPLVALALGDCRQLARRLSCDQDIAADGFFSLGMIADFDAGLGEHGLSFYRHLFWESGVVGQVLYLEAEAAGARSTGIGCFYDDPVHETLGLTGHAFQSLYHFTVGMPVEDTRLTTEPGYAWENLAIG